MTLVDILPFATGFGGSAVTWIVARRKRKAEAGSVELNNSDKIIDQYRKSLDDLGQRYEEKYQELVRAFEGKVKILEDEIKLHKRRHNLLKQENADLRRQLKAIKGE